MSEIKLEAGQWYRNREGTICYCVGPLKRETDRFMVETANGLCDEFEGNGLACKTTDQDDDDEWKNLDLIEHLPDCTGFDWEPPKPIVAPEGWRLLTEGERIRATDKWWKGMEWSDLPIDTLDANKAWNQKQYHPMARKIEPTYRPFKDDVEYQPERERWFRHKIDLYVTRVTCFTERNIWVGAATVGTSYAEAFEAFEFLDGTPFGVRVDE